MVPNDSRNHDSRNQGTRWHDSGRISLQFCLAYLEPAETLVEFVVEGSDRKVFVQRNPLATNLDVTAAKVVDDASGQPAVEITFKPVSAKRIQEVTRQHLNKAVAILLNDKLLSAPTINEPFGNKAVITGRFSREEAERIASAVTQCAKHAESTINALSTRTYRVGHLPLWTHDGTTLKPDLLIHRVKSLFGRSWADGTTKVQYYAGQRSLIVSTADREHNAIARLIEGQPPQYVPPEVLVPAENERTKTYSISDLPIWTSDGKSQNVFWLIKYLEQEMDPMPWSVGTIYATYYGEKQQLIINALEDDHKKIAGALAALRADIAKSDDQPHTTAPR